MIAFHMYHRPYNLIRTSSAIIRELIEFRRIMEHYYNNKTNGAQPQTEFFECTNPYKDKKR